MRARTAIAAGVLALASAAVLPLACSGDDDAAISETAAIELQPRVAEIRQLATAGQPEAALAKVAELDAVLDDLVERDELSAGAAAAVLDQAHAVADELQHVTTTTTATTAPPPTEPPPPAGDDEERDEGGGHGHGNGHGHRDD